MCGSDVMAEITTSSQDHSVQPVQHQPEHEHGADDVNIPANVMNGGQAAPSGDAQNVDAPVPGQHGEEHSAHDESVSDDRSSENSEEGIDEEPEDNDPEAKKQRRKRVLTRKLVDERKDAKAEMDAELNEDPESGITHGSVSTKKLDDAAKGFGGVGAATGLGSSIAGQFIDDSPSGIIDGVSQKQMNAGVGIFGAGMGAVANSLKLGTNIYKASKSKSRYKRKAARMKAASGGLGLLGNAASIAGGLGSFGVYGQKQTVLDPAGGSGTEYDPNKTVSGFTDIGGGIVSSVSSILDYSANRSVTNAHRKIGRDTRRYLTDNLDDSKSKLANSRRKIKELKNVGAGNLTDEQKQELKLARKARRTAKAKMFAMKQASDMNTARGRQHTPGVLGLIGGMSSGIGSLLKGIAKFTGQSQGILGYIGMGLGMLGGAIKTFNSLREAKKAVTKPKDGLKNNKHSVVDDYLIGKIRKIKEQAAAMLLDRAESRDLGSQGKTLSDDEAKRIALLRLGVDVDEHSDNLTDANYNEAFKKITEKRAKNILKARDADKTEMLNKLGLDPDATLEDVTSALSGA